MKRWGFLVPVLLAVGVYFPAPSGELVWDDHFIVEDQVVADLLALRIALETELRRLNSRASP